MDRPPRWVVLTTVLGALALGVAGLGFYFAQRQYLDQTANINLTTISQSYVEAIVAWRAERLADGAALRGSSTFSRSVAQWLAAPRPGTAADILTRLRTIKDSYGYLDVRLVDRAGRVLLAAGGRTGGLDPDEIGALSAAFQDGRPTMTDVYWAGDDSLPRVSVVAPLFAPGGRLATPIGALVQVLDARRSLLRLVESWPTRSPSAEAALVRRDGDSVLHLSERRFEPATGLPRRVSLSRRDAPAVMAVLGAEGVARGVDYRGVSVLAALRAVPGTPWYLVAKVDQAEVLAVWRLRASLVFILLLAVVLVAAATAIAIGQRFAKAHYRRLYAAKSALGESEARFRALVEEAGDGFALLDAEGRYLDVNGACCRHLDYTREELLRLNIADTDPLFPPGRFAADFQSLVGKLPVTYESAHRRKDGTTFPVEVTLSVVSIGGVSQALSLARDITERKQAEETVRESQREMADALEFSRSILRTSSIGILAYGQSGQCTFANEAAAKIVGTDVAGLLAQDFHRIQPWKESGVYDAARQALATDTEQRHEARLVTTFGRDVWLNLRFSTFHSGGEQNLLVFVYDVTERERAEEALQKSSQLLRDTGEMAEVGGWELDFSTKDVFWTEEVNRIHGVEPGHKPKLEEALDFYAPESRPEVEAVLKKAAETGEPYDLESLFIPRGSKDKIWVRSLGRAVYSGGKVVKLAGTFQNIDKYKRAEEALRREHTMLARAEGIAHVGSWEWDIASDTVLWSDELFRIFQRNPQEGAPSFAEHPALYHPDDMARLRQAVEVAVAEGTPYELELRAIRRDGETRVCVARGVAEMSPGGRAVRLCGSLQDITERKRVEEALRESEERYRSVIEQLHDVYYRTDRDGFITMMSPSGARLVGLPSTTEMIGRPVESFWKEPGRRAEFLAAIGKRGFVHDFEATAMRADGTPVAVALSSQYVRDASGAVVGVEGIVRDITQRNQAEAALRALARHLDSVREEEHTRIAREVHDELGQALTALRLDLEWVARKLPEGDTALRPRIAQALGLAGEMITIGQRIVGELRPPVLDDLGLVAALEWHVQSLAQRTGLDVAIEVEGEEPVVPRPLAITAYRIVQEALSNVARHAQATHVSLCLGKPDGCLTIEVRDDGQGIREEVTRDPRSFGLVGMRERAAVHGGAVEVSSAPGAGTTVRVTLPLERRKEPRAPQ